MAPPTLNGTGACRLQLELIYPLPVPQT